MENDFLKKILRFDFECEILRTIVSPFVTPDGKIVIFLPRELKVDSKKKTILNTGTKINRELSRDRKLFDKFLLGFSLENEFILSGLVCQSKNFISLDESDEFKIMFYNPTEEEIIINKGTILGAFFLIKRVKD
jgi:hypothetical protein